MIFIFRFQYSVGVVAPYCQAFVDAIKATFKNGASDYRRDSRVWLFDMEDGPKVLELIKANFPQVTIKFFISTDELVSAE